MRMWYDTGSNALSSSTKRPLQSQYTSTMSYFLSSSSSSVFRLSFLSQPMKAFTFFVGIIVICLLPCSMQNIYPPMNMYPQDQYPVRPPGSQGSYMCTDMHPREQAQPVTYCTTTSQCYAQYAFSECDWNGYNQRICWCQCGYRWDPISRSCVLRDGTDDSWYYMRNYGPMLAIVIIILVIVILIAMFAIPTCAFVSCFSNKSG